MASSNRRSCLRKSARGENGGCTPSSCSSSGSSSGTKYCLVSFVRSAVFLAKMLSTRRIVAAAAGAAFATSDGVFGGVGIHRPRCCDFQEASLRTRVFLSGRFRYDPLTVPIIFPCVRTKQRWARGRGGHCGLGRLSSSSSDDDEDQPPPPNYPSPLDMDALQRRMARQENQYAELISTQSSFVPDKDGNRISQLPENISVVLFHPDTPQQNAHAVEIPMGSGNHVVLAFEDGNECAKFAGMLQELRFENPSPQEFPFDALAKYCQSIGVSVAIVPTGFDLTPPQLNVDEDGDVEGGGGDKRDREEESAEEVGNDSSDDGDVEDDQTSSSWE